MSFLLKGIREGEREINDCVAKNSGSSIFSSTVVKKINPKVQDQAL